MRLNSNMQVDQRPAGRQRGDDANCEQRSLKDFHKKTLVKRCDMSKSNKDIVLTSRYHTIILLEVRNIVLSNARISSKTVSHLGCTTALEDLGTILLLAIWWNQLKIAKIILHLIWLINYDDIYWTDLKSIKSAHISSLWPQAPSHSLSPPHKRHCNHGRQEDESVFGWPRIRSRVHSNLPGPPSGRDQVFF